jgi:hypothetical protein
LCSEFIVDEQLHFDVNFMVFSSLISIYPVILLLNRLLCYVVFLVNVV